MNIVLMACPQAPFKSNPPVCSATGGNFITSVPVDVTFTSGVPAQPTQQVVIQIESCSNDFTNVLDTLATGENHFTFTHAFVQQPGHIELTLNIDYDGNPLAGNDKITARKLNCCGEFQGMNVELAHLLLVP